MHQADNGKMTMAGSIQGIVHLADNGKLTMVDSIRGIVHQADNGRQHSGNCATS